MDGLAMHSHVSYNVDRKKSNFDFPKNLGNFAF